MKDHQLLEVLALRVGKVLEGLERFEPSPQNPDEKTLAEDATRALEEAQEFLTDLVDEVVN